MATIQTMLPALQLSRRETAPFEQRNMAKVFCDGCGCVFEAGASACPRCGRCPNCGTFQSGAGARCPACGYPGDDHVVRDLEARLDPGLARNQKVIRSLDRGWQTTQLMEKLRGGRMLIALLFLATAIAIVSVGFITAVGLDGRWVVPLGLLFGLVSLHKLLRLLRKGWFPWLFRRGTSSH
jgi:hypothetical protein